MKITCSKRDDILQRKAAYEKEYGERKARYDEQTAALDDAQFAIFNSIEKKILAALSGLKIDIDVAAQGRRRGLEVVVSSYDRDVHNENKALSWKWTTTLDENGTIKNETSSWSGLQATTPAQLDSLRDVLKALEILNNMDWATLLNVELPKYKDYVTEFNPDYDPDKPDFDSELVMADIEDTIGKPILIAGNVINSRFSNVGAYYKILRETPAMYEIVELSGRAIDALMRGESYEWGSREISSVAEFVQVNTKEYTRKIKKDKFIETMVKRPVETIQY